MNEALTLRLGGELLAVDARSVREIVDPVPATRVPGAPAAIDAIINVRGRVVPLADLRLLFGLERRPADGDSRFVLVEIRLDGEEVVVALLVDSVCEVTDIDPDTIQDPPSTGTRWPPEWLNGIGRHGGEFVFLPDLPRIFERLGGETPPTAPQERSFA